jgi:hypothetical protein
MNSHKITNLANATADADALNRITADNRFYQNTTTLDSITAPTATVSLNSQKLSNLANATADSDALNRITADGRFYQNTVALNDITVPDDVLSLNSQKISDLANASLSTDAMAYKQNTFVHYLYYGLSSTQSSAGGLTLPYTIPFDQSFQPARPSDLASYYTASNGIVTFESTGVFRVNLTLLLRYRLGTD